MNIKIKNFVRNFSYALSSNIISLMISALVILLAPKILGVKDYGYWQLYLFYASYVGFLHMGWNDGIYLRYGGKEYKDLDKRLFYSQFYMQLLLQSIFFIIIITLSTQYIFDEKRLKVIIFTALNMLFINIRYMLIFILQATNRIKEYSRVIILDRIFFLLLIVTFLLIGLNNFKVLIIADLIAKFSSLLYAMYICRDIVFKNVSLFYFSFKETYNNIVTGSKIMFANISSKLIVGVVRLGVEKIWGISIFGKISLTLSISQFLLTFINAVGLVLFPALRRINEERLSLIYLTIRNLFTVLSFGVLLFYFPIKYALSLWLPEYADHLIYMAILFPIIVYEGKMSILINTFFKTIRKENSLLYINLVSLILSILFTTVSGFLLKNLNLTILTISLVLLLRSVIGEIILAKFLKLSIYKDLILEIFITGIFISSSWLINSLYSFIIYFITYIIFLFFMKKDIIVSLQKLKMFAKA